MFTSVGPECVALARVCAGVCVFGRECASSCRVYIAVFIAYKRASTDKNAPTDWRQSRQDSDHVAHCCEPGDLLLLQSRRVCERVSLRGRKTSHYLLLKVPHYAKLALPIIFIQRTLQT